MSPEDWKTYWRTCHLTPFQVEALERRESAIHKAEAMVGARVKVKAAYSGTVLVWVDQETVSEAVDSMELQMMGIRP